MRPHGLHRGLGMHPHGIMMGPHHMGIGVGVIVPPPRPIIVADPLYGQPPPPMYHPYGYGPRYYDDGEVVCCCNIF